eukprot:3504193-Ditylum_brightwellii.AAC.1
MLDEGSKWPPAELDFEKRRKDLDKALDFRNHRGATKQPDLLRKLVEKDVTHGYSLVIPLSKLKTIPGAILASMNIMQQSTINETGKIVEKDRLTHDQSYKWSVGHSVNSRVDKDSLLPCMFGACIKRIVNWAVVVRKKYPKRRILSTQVDCKLAYQWDHLNAETAIQTCTQLPEESLAVILLRLMFGGSPGPYEWEVPSESICNLVNEILQKESWDPEELFAQISSLVPKKKILDDE